MQIIIRKWHEYHRFFPLIEGSKVKYWSVIFGAVIMNALIQILMAYMNRSFFNALLAGDRALFLQGGILAGLVLVLSYVYPFCRYLHIRIVRVQIYELKLKLYKKLTHMNIHFFEKKHSGEHIQKISLEAESLKTAYFTEVFVLLNLLICGITALVNMVIFSPILSLISLVSIVLTLQLTKGLQAAVKQQSKQIQEKTTKVVVDISSILNGFLIIKLFSGASRIIDLFEDNNEELTLAQIQRGRKLASVQAIAFLTGILGGLGVILVGSLLVYSNQLDFGTVMAVVSLQVGLSAMLQSFSFFKARLGMSMVKGERLQSFLGEAVKEVKPLRIAKNMIEIENVSFKYLNTDHWVIRDFSLVVKPGESLLIQGESGCGKSTLIKLMLGFYEPTEGRIKVSKNYTGKGLFSYVPQDSYLFEGTIYDNILMGRPKASRQEVIEAAKLSQSYSFIMELEQGFETLVESTGRNLSGGEKQRINIARALLSQAPVVVFDEPTSSLDLPGQDEIFSTMRGLKGIRTVIIISHRMIENMWLDHIVKMDAISE